MDQMIDWIVGEVMQRLQTKKKKALVLFTGGAIGFPEAIANLVKLLKDGWELKVVLSDHAEYVLTPKLIKEQLKIDEVYLEREIEGLKELYDGMDVLILPVLTLNSAAKIALGIADTLVTNVVSHGIMEGLTMIAAKDACDLDHPIREKMGMNQMPPVYRERMGEYIQTLERYGIQMVEAKELYQAVTGRGDEPIKKKMEPKHISKRVLSRVDIVEAKNEGRDIQIEENAIVTSLAKEAAEELGVKILRA